MLSRKLSAVALLIAVGSTSAAYADDQGVNTLLGAAVGAAIGHGINGRDGAIVGGVLGAAVGASANTYDQRRYYGSPPATTYYSAPTTTYYAAPEPTYYAQPAPAYYARPPVYVEPAPVYYRSAPIVVEERYYRGGRHYYGDRDGSRYGRYDRDDRWHR